MRRIFRSTDCRMITGVCGGIAEYFNIDPTFVRLGCVALAFTGVFSVPVILSYIAGSIIIPEDSGEDVN